MNSDSSENCIEFSGVAPSPNGKTKDGLLSGHQIGMLLGISYFKTRLALQLIEPDYVIHKTRYYKSSRLAELRRSIEEQYPNMVARIHAALPELERELASQSAEPSPTL